MEEKLANVITILPKKKFASDYIYRHIATTHTSHYVRWCENHNMDSSLMSTVVTYVNTCWYESLGDYALVYQHYNVNDVARALRMFSYSLPVSGEWETEDEMQNYCEFVQAFTDVEEKLNATNENNNG